MKPQRSGDVGLPGRLAAVVRQSPAADNRCALAAGYRLRRNLQNHTSMIDVSAGYDRENRFALLISIEAKHKKSNG